MTNLPLFLYAEIRQFLAVDTSLTCRIKQSLPPSLCVFWRNKHTSKTQLRFLKQSQNLLKFHFRIWTRCEVHQNVHLLICLENKLYSLIKLFTYFFYPYWYVKGSANQLKIQINGAEFSVFKSRLKLIMLCISIRNTKESCMLGNPLTIGTCGVTETHDALMSKCK